jgi:O-antigen/teichoic acid export membrane protein
MFLPTLAIASVMLPVLGQERFGVLMTILSLMAFLTIADLGVGSSIITSISKAHGSQDLASVRRLQLIAAAIIGVIALLLAACGMLLLFSDIGSSVFPKSSPAIHEEATRGLATFAILFAISLPFNLVSKIQVGLQLGHVANYWQTAAAIVNFLAGCWAAWQGLPIPSLVVALMSGTLVCGAANLILHVTRNQLLSLPLPEIAGRDVFALLKQSSVFLALQIIFTVCYAADTLIVARYAGAEQASVYALGERLFSIVAVAVSVITTQLWAAYGNAFGAADQSWAERILRLSTLRIGCAAALLSCGLLVMLKPIVGLLSSGGLIVPFSLALAMAGWRVIEAVGSSLSAFLFARESLHFVLATGAITAVVSFGLKLLILPNSNLFSMPLIMTGCYVLLCLLPTLYYLRFAHSRIETPE